MLKVSWNSHQQKMIPSLRLHQLLFHSNSPNCTQLQIQKLYMIMNALSSTTCMLKFDAPKQDTLTVAVLAGVFHEL